MSDALWETAAPQTFQEKAAYWDAWAQTKVQQALRSSIELVLVVRSV